VALVLTPTTYRKYTGDKSETVCEGDTVGEVMRAFVSMYPDVKTRLFDDRGRIRSSVHVFVQKQDIKTLQGLDTPVLADTEIRLIPAIAGG
jgi:adenylyltransferase/sulfurtransferase